MREIEANSHRDAPRSAFARGRQTYHRTVGQRESHFRKTGSDDLERTRRGNLRDEVGGLDGEVIFVPIEFEDIATFDG